MAWALEAAANPAVLRIHTTVELTTTTIQTCPPARPPDALGPLIAIGGVRSIDLHRYRVRMNLLPDADPGSVAATAVAALREAWGPAAALADHPDEQPRAFTVSHPGPRAVAESREMAGSDPILLALFDLEGVAEAVLGDGLALVRLGRLFGWEELEPLVVRALAASAPR